MTNENIIVLPNGDIDATNIIWNPSFPIELCGKLNEDGKLMVKDCVAFARVDVPCIDDRGILLAPRELVIPKL
jgi:hypothetical protein